MSVAIWGSCRLFLATLHAALLCLCRRMPAASAKAIATKRGNFNGKRRAAADAKILRKPAVAKILQEKDACIATLQRQLDAKQRDSTQTMTQVHELSKRAKQHTAELDTLRTRLSAAEQRETKALRDASSARSQLETVKKNNEEIKRQNKALHDGWQAWNNIKLKLTAPKTGPRKWKD